jgi:hypothetical protein
MTIDTLSVCSWALAAVWFWRALATGRTWDWFWLGLIIGAGFLAKFTNGVQLICIAFFLLWSRAHRPLLFSRKTLATALAFTLASLPILWWNVQTGWVHATALRSRSGVDHSFQIHPLEALRFVGEQFGVISPLLMAGMAVAAVALSVRRHEDLRTRFLLSQFLPLYGLFLFFSLNKAGQPNWTAPALVTGIIFTVVYWRELATRRPASRWLIKTALGVALVMTLALHASSLLPLPPQLNLLHRALGWEQGAARVERARTQHQAPLLIARHYGLASLMTFYLPDHPTTYLPPAPYGASQFTLWPTYTVTPATRALYLAWNTNTPPATLQQQFSKIELVDDFWTQHGGRPMNRIAIFLCTSP